VMTAASGEFQSHHLAMEIPPSAPRSVLWHERAISRRILAPLSDGPLHVDTTVHRLAGPDIASHVCVQRMTFTAPCTAQRTPALVADGNDDVILHIHEAGSRTLSQLGREATVTTGGAVLSSVCDVSTTVLDPCRFVSVGVPRKPMQTLAPGLEDALVRPLPADSLALRLLAGYLEVLSDDRALSTPDLRRTVAAHIHDLYALAIGATRDAAEIARGRGLRVARLRAIKADVVRNLRDGDVSVTALAGRHHVTARYIQRLFESEGTTLSRFVLDQRLVRVHCMLTDPRHADRKIAALAYDAGFGDLSTFNWEFRRRFGGTPSDVRAAAQGSSAR
jgi:AraC-like DNA-binding protein